MKPRTPTFCIPAWTLCIAACFCCAVPRTFADPADPAPPNAAPVPTASAADLRKQVEALKYKDPKASAALYAQLVSADAVPADKADDLDNQADELLAVSDWKMAEQLARQVLDLHKQAMNGEGEGKSERIIARALCGQGKDQDAIAFCKDALVLDRNAHHGDEEASALRVEGIAYVDLSQYQKALDCYVQVLPIFRSVNDREGEARALNGTGIAYVDLSQYQKAVGYYVQALPIFRSVGDRDGEANALMDIGNAYVDLSQYQKAVGYYVQALPIFRSVSDQDGEAGALMNTGIAYRSLSQYQRAISYYTQASPIFRSVGDLDGEARALMVTGIACKSLGQYQKAVGYYVQALPVYRSVGDQDGEGDVLTCTGNAYDDLSQYQKAVECFSRALLIYRSVGDRDGEASALMDTGITYVDLSQCQKAVGYFAQALPVFRNVGDRNGEANTLENTGIAYNELSQYQKAVGYFAQALPIYHSVGDRDGEAHALANTGAAYDGLSQYATAVNDYTQALSIFRNVSDRNGEANALTNTGVSYDKLSQYHKAIGYYTQALPIYRSVGDRDNEAENLHELLLAFRGHAGTPRNAPLAAIAFGKQAVNLLQQIRTEISGMDKTSQQAYAKSKESTYRDLADILIAKGRLAEAEQVLAMLQEQEYFEFIGHDRSAAPSLKTTVAYTRDEQIYLDQFDHLADAVEQRQTAVAALAKQKKQGTAGYKTATVKLATASKAFSTFLAESPKRFHNAAEGTAQTQNSQNYASALQRSLATAQGRPWHLRTCAIYTLEADTHYDVILVTPTGQQAGAYPIKANALNAKVEALRQAISDTAHDPRLRAKDLYDILLGPVAKEIDSYRPDLVIWSLDGPLGTVPVSALYDGRRYAVQRWQSALFNADSISALSEPSPGHDFAGALGMGVSKGRTVGEDTFGDLAGVPDELGGIFDDPAHRTNGPVPGRYLLDGDFKTKDAMTRFHAGGHRLVHLATHFKLDPGGSARSYLLTGDGVLTLADLNAGGRIFKDVDLLTLSACSTAVGERNALNATAQLLGARAILATLWDVSDASTAQFMKSFYGDMTAASRKTDGKPITTAEAVREAQLSLLGSPKAAPTVAGKPAAASPAAHRGVELIPQAGERTLPEFVSDPTHPYAHPYYWAAFVLLGNWR